MRDANLLAGPDELLRLKRQYLVPCVYHFYKQPPQIVAGEGCWLIDHTGRRYLDCFSGVTVTSAGHSNWEILEPVIRQLCTLQHTTSITPFLHVKAENGAKILYQKLGFRVRRTIQLTVIAPAR